MRARWKSLSGPRRFIGDLMHFAAQVPTVPVQRRMHLGAVADARTALAERPCWPAIFLKGYARVAAETPALRRAYVALPWPHLCEFSNSVASLAVEREHRGEPAVFFARIFNPSKRSLLDLHAQIRAFAETPIDQVPTFRKALLFSRLPRPLRRLGLWLALNIGRLRPGMFGTFALTVYSSLGAESLHPLSPLTTTLNYGVIGPDGAVDVRVIYDHRVLDGATIARALARLEAELNGAVLDEIQALANSGRAAA